MTPPGARLRGLSARLFSAKTMERLIDPVLADLQAEYSGALERGDRWRSRRVRIAGYIAFLKAVAVYGCERSIGTLHDWPADDRRALRRTVAFAGCASFALTALLIVPPWRASRYPMELIYLIQQSIPLAVTVGLTLGVFWGLGGARLSRRLTGSIVAIAAACSVASFVTMSWVIPAANQEWRVSLASRLAGINGARVTLSRGAAELTLGELKQHLDSVRSEGSSRRADTLALHYHRRRALPCASFALALFALSAIPRQPVRRRTLVVAAAFAACVGYYALMFVGELAAREGALTAAAAVWLPNLGFAVVSAALVLRRSHLPRASAHA